MYFIHANHAYHSEGNIATYNNNMTTSYHASITVGMYELVWRSFALGYGFARLCMNMNDCFLMHLYNHDHFLMH